MNLEQPNREVNVTEEVDHLMRLIGITRAAEGRFSALLALHIWMRVKTDSINPAKVIAEIEALEGRGPPSRTKPPTLFTGKHLRGLWHKHYHGEGVQAVAHNIRKGLRRHGSPLFQEKIREADEANEVRYVQPEDIPALVNDMVQTNYERVANAAALTGDWLIYAIHNGQNFYLTIASHETQDQLIRAEIEQVCVPQFPFLREILSPLSS